MEKFKTRKFAERFFLFGNTRPSVLNPLSLIKLLRINCQLHESLNNTESLNIPRVITSTNPSVRLGSSLNTQATSSIFQNLLK